MFGWLVGWLMSVIEIVLDIIDWSASVIVLVFGCGIAMFSIYDVICQASRLCWNPQ